MKYVATFLVLFASYLALAGFELQELLLGAVISVALTFILAKHVNFTLDYRFPVRLLVFVFAYVPLFVFQLILSNIDVAFRVLSPKIPLNPGFVKTRLTDLNNFKMPCLISANEASNYIIKGINQRDFEIHFPKKFTLLMKLIKILPNKVFFKLSTKLLKNNEK